MLEFAEARVDPPDDAPDLAWRSDPRAAGFDLAVERKGGELAHRLFIVGIILRSRSPYPVCNGVIERAKVLLERRARDLARAPRVAMTEHVKGDHHFAVPRVSGLPPCIAVAFKQWGEGPDWDGHQRVPRSAGKVERLRRLGSRDV